MWKYYKSPKSFHFKSNKDGDVSEFKQSLVDQGITDDITGDIKQFEIRNMCPLTGEDYKSGRTTFWNHIKYMGLDPDNIDYEECMNYSGEITTENTSKLMGLDMFPYIWQNYFKGKMKKTELKLLIGFINIDLLIRLVKIYRKEITPEGLMDDNKVEEEMVEEENVEEETVEEEKVEEEEEKEYIDIHENYNKLKEYYDTILNKDKKSFKTTNDEPTPISCIEEMIKKIPTEFWGRVNKKILDPCCGNGNFFIPIYKKLKESHNDSEIFKILNFNDTNNIRINNIKKIFKSSENELNITMNDFLQFREDIMYDLIVANPPYAKLLENGKRASKNHNMIKEFIIKSIKILNYGGYLLYITPDNWMSKADRNTLIMELTKYQIIHLNIHTAKDHFPKIGSSFTWYIIEKKPYYKDINVEGRWRGKGYISSVPSRIRTFIPQFYTRIIDSICLKTIDNDYNEKFKIETTSDLHKYTKRDLISIDNDTEHPYKLIHTPKQTVYSSRAHKWQDGWKVFISTTDRYGTFIDNCGMTQSIAFIRCESKEQCELYKFILDHDLYKFINDICRWGNFNNIRILQSFPIPKNKKDIWNNFNLTTDEIEFIKGSL